MGYDPDLFINKIDDELKCPICYRVLEEPVQGFDCDHIYCKECITSWLNHNPRCPMDRQVFAVSQLRPPPKMLVNLLSRLEVRCTNSSNGCFITVPLGQLGHHLSWCWFDGSKSTSEFIEQKPKPLAVLRRMADFSEDVTDMKSCIEMLQDRVKEESDRSKEMADSVKLFSDRLKESQKRIQEVCDPLIRILVGEDSEMDNSIFEEFLTADISITNLNEFTNEGVLIEYLRQNDIYVDKCVQHRSIATRSRDFTVTIRYSDRKKILMPDLWPWGVTIRHIGDNAEYVSGSRTKDMPGLTIQPGLSSWTLGP